ncbi:MAG: DNA double-strand break repair nuclease NurA [Dehalococcoidia bacterium]
MFKLPSIESVECLFREMEPLAREGEPFTPSLHTEELLLDDVVAEGEEDEEVAALNEAKLGPFTPFGGTGVPSALAAIDAGVVDLGLTRTGFALAFKAAAVMQSADGAHSVAKVGPRVKLITPENRAELLRYVGEGLMNPTMFVEEQPDGALTIKAGAREPNQFKDRIRNYIERMMQLDLARQLVNGILLVDGALTLRTYNTPEALLDRLAREAAQRNSDIIGVSKKSRVTVGGVHISALLDDTPPQAGYRRILAEDAEGSDTLVGARNLGQPFAVRFAPGGFTFRVDVARRSLLASEEDVLEALYTNTRMTLGYPNLLRLAHIHSAFTKSEIVSLQVQAAHDYGMAMRAPEDLSVIFAPFRKGLGG